MRKKGIIIVLMLSIICVGIGANGKPDADNLNEITSYGNKSYTLSVTTFSNYQGHSLFGRSLDEGAEYNWLLSHVKLEKFKINDESKIPKEVKSIKFFNNSREYYSGPITILDNRLKVDNDGTIKKIFNANELGFGEQKLRFLVLLNRKDDVTKKSWDFHYVEGDVFLEFFPGEELLFGKYLDDDTMNTAINGPGVVTPDNISIDLVFSKEQIYRLKAVSLMYLILFYNEIIGSGNTAFLNIGDLLLKDLNEKASNFYFHKIVFSHLVSKLQAIMDIYNSGFPGSPIPGTDFAAIDNFKNTMKKHFVYKNQKVDNNSLYYMNVSQPSFYSIYGPLATQIAGSGRNIYLAAYILLCFKNNKPLLSYLTAKELDHKSKIQYNYKDYFALSKSDGELLSKNALKYLNWGVEYTPYSVADSLQLYSLNKDIFEKNKDAIKQWIDPEFLNNQDRMKGSRANNYFPTLKIWNGIIPTTKINYEASNAGTSISTEHFYENLCELSAISFGAYLKNPYELSKMDLWSSNNIAWQEKSIKTITANGSFLGRINNKCRADFAVLNQSADKSLSAGYVFYDAKKINAMLLIGKMQSENTTGEYSHKIILKQNGKSIELEKDRDTGGSENLLKPLNNAIATKQLTTKDNKLGNWVSATTSIEGTVIDGGTYYAGMQYAFDGKQDGSYFWSSGGDKTPKMTINLETPSDVECIKIYWRRGIDAHCDIYIGEKIGECNEKITSIEKADFSITAEKNWDYSKEITIATINKKIASIKIDVTKSLLGVSILEVEVIRLNKYYKEIVADSSGTVKILLPGMESGNDADVKYRYYIFNKVFENIDEVKIVYNGVKLIQAEEILVFEHNPLKHLLQGNIYTSALEGKQKQIMSNTDISKGEKYIGLGKADNSSQKLKVYSGKNLATVIGEIDLKQYFEVYGDPITILNNQNTSIVYYIRFPQKKIEGYSIYSTTNEESTIKNFEIESDKIFLSMNIENLSQIKTIVLWDKKGNNALSSEPVLFTGNREFLKDLFIKGTEEILELTSVLPELQTPFYKIENNIPVKMLGNPLPYAPFGIDSPRTFAYKMYEQQIARQWYKAKYIEIHKKEDDRFTSKDSLLAINNDRTPVESYANSYLTEQKVFDILGQRINIDMSNPLQYINYSIPSALDKTIKPFLPGYYLSTSSKGYFEKAECPYQPDKAAGVDSVGLLVGAVSMSGINIFDLLNRNITANLDNYYDFNKSAFGTDASGKPVFYTGNNNSIIQGNFRLTQADIEKCSIVVPDISMIQKGDIIVRNNDNGIPHIGIIVGFAWENLTENDNDRPKFGADARTFYNKVYILSIRPGLQHVVLGTWGNSIDGIFGGFTDNPEQYHIRRLLTTNKTPSQLTAFEGKEIWECVTEVKINIYDEYPENWRVPFDNIAYYSSINSDAEATAKIINEKHFYYSEIPGTHLNRPAARSLQKNINGTDMIMSINSHTGWRWSNTEKAMAYHKAVDLAGSMYSAIYAPEDGYYYYINTDDKNNQKIKLSGNDSINTGNIEYTNTTYGHLLVFITSKDELELHEGRIYVICHLGKASDRDSAGNIIKTYDFNYTIDRLRESYSLYHEGNIFENIPLSFDTAIPVKAGDWIGCVGSKGEGSGEHIHLEIFEWFDQIAKSTPYWRRVNPKSIFFGKYILNEQPYYIKLRTLIENESTKEEYFKSLPEFIKGF